MNICWTTIVVHDSYGSEQFHIRLLCLQAEVNTSDICGHRLNHCLFAHEAVGIVLAYWIVTHIVHVLVVVFTLVGRPEPGSDFLVSSWQLIVAGYYCYYHCLPNNNRSRQLTNGPIYWKGWMSVSGIVCTHVSCIWSVRMLYLAFYYYY